MATVDRPGPLRRLFGGLWDALNFTRRLVFNLLFLAVLLFLLVAILSGPSVKPVQDKSALVLELGGVGLGRGWVGVGAGAGVAVGVLGLGLRFGLALRLG